MEIIEELETIKMLIITILVGMVLITSSVLFMTYIFYRGAMKIREQHGDKAFRMTSEDYLARNKIEDLIEHVEDRLKLFPHDVWAHWYMGQAKYFSGALAESKHCFSRVVELEPSWETSANSWLDRIDEKLSEGPSLVP